MQIVIGNLGKKLLARLTGFSSFWRVFIFCLLRKQLHHIQKIVAFENAFDRLLEVISEEGYSDGGKCLCSKSRLKPCESKVLLHLR